MSEESVAIADLERRISRLEADVEPIPNLVAGKHTHANKLQEHVGKFDLILGPKDSLLTQVADLRGHFNLMRADIDAIKGTIESIQSDVAQILESYELQKANVVGLWQMRATMATAVIAALSAVAVAAMQFLP
jgi:hypothetical protein